METLFRQLNHDEIIAIYNGPMRRDFVPEEVRPLDIILGLRGGESYSCYGLMEGSEPRAYAFVAELDGWLLLEYLAADSRFRGHGLGSRMLGELAKLYSGHPALIVEAESPNSASGEQLEVRNRRLSFYRRNGFIKSGVMSNLFGTEFDILYYPLSGPVGDRQLEEHLSALYDLLFPAHIRRNYVSAGLGRAPETLPYIDFSSISW